MSASEIKEVYALTYLCPSHMCISWGAPTLSYVRGMSIHGPSGSGEWMNSQSQHPISSPKVQLEPQNLPHRSTPSDWQAAVSEVWQPWSATPSTVLLFEYSDQCGQGAGLPASWQRFSEGGTAFPS